MEILAELGDVAVARADQEHLPTIARLLADDPTSPQYVATTTLISDEILGPLRAVFDLEPFFERIIADPNQLLAVVLDEGDRAIGTFQLTMIPTLGRGGALLAVASNARVRAGADSVAVSKRVFTWVIEHARAQGAKALLVIAEKERAHMHGFFTTMGFRPTHDGLVLPL
ncbi:MAG: GNAT family N-acetyltransferase [Propioniciclava sp.]|uniref:GNAT family N-acetyltransferase n=1 Tax=Propioniciclava sp. TaxID=2038686 RepID=UPI0039E22CE6